MALKQSWSRWHSNQSKSHMQHNHTCNNSALSQCPIEPSWTCQRTRWHQNPFLYLSDSAPATLPRLLLFFCIALFNISSSKYFLNIDFSDVMSLPILAISSFLNIKPQPVNGMFSNRWGFSINGDNFKLSSSVYAALSGYPNITIPMGFIENLPVGISFFGRKWSEPSLIEIAYSYEQGTKHRKAPRFFETD